MKTPAKTRTRKKTRNDKTNVFVNTFASQETIAELIDQITSVFFKLDKRRVLPPVVNKLFKTVSCSRSILLPLFLLLSSTFSEMAPLSLS